MYTVVDFSRAATGRTIRRLRKEKGISQEVLSGLAGMARSHLAMIETGVKQPNFETIWRIAGALEISPHELVRKVEREAQM